MGLWTGEEQGLLGSRAYVKEHFADRETMALKPEHAKLALYLNMDNGGGVFRGRLPAGQRSDRADLRGVDEAVRQHGHDDEHDPPDERHRSPLVRCGRPARLPVHSDPLEYSSRTHHTNLDVMSGRFPMI